MSEFTKGKSKQKLTSRATTSPSKAKEAERALYALLGLPVPEELTERPKRRSPQRGKAQKKHRTTSELCDIAWRMYYEQGMSLIDIGKAMEVLR